MSSTIQNPESLQELIDRELPPNPSWIEPNILTKRGKLLFGGESKTGKSLVMLSLVRALITGEAPLECHLLSVPKPCKVLMIEQELGPYGLQQRARKIYKGIDRDILNSNLWYSTRIPEFQLNTFQGRDLLKKWIDQVEPNVVVIDPIGKSQAYDENSNTQIAKLWNIIDYSLKDYDHLDLSFIISHHFGKPNKDPRYAGDPLDIYNFRGASKWRDDPDTLIAVHRHSNLSGRKDAWNIHTRWELRHGEPMEDLVFEVNKDLDLRVKYKGVVELPIKVPKKEEFQLSRLGGR